MLVFSFLNQYSHMANYMLHCQGFQVKKKICMMVEGEKYKQSNKTFTKNVVYKEIFDCYNNKNNYNNDLENNNNTGNDFDVDIIDNDVDIINNNINSN